jgi:hemoglobin
MLKKLTSVFKKPISNLPMYIVLGEETGTYELVKTFYEVMESDPKAIDCLHSHKLIDGKIEDEVKKKLFMFLCGWFGGPNLFVQTYGAPQMRGRHLNVAIGEKEKDQWLYCMKKAIDKHSSKIKSSNKKIMNNSFTALAMRIQNK